MLAGIGVTMLYVFQHKGIFFIPGTAFLGDMGPDWFLGISPNAFGAVGALVNFVVAIVGLEGDRAAAGAHPAPGRRHPRAERCNSRCRPLSQILWLMLAPPRGGAFFISANRRCAAGSSGYCNAYRRR